MSVWRAAFAASMVMLAPPALLAQPPRASPPVLVLPFDNPSDEPRVSWLAEGAALLLTDELSARGVPVIARRDRLAAFERLQVPPIAALSRASVIRLGEIVGASAVLFGVVEPSGGTFEVRVRRIHLDTGRLDPEVTARGSLDAVFAVFEQLAPQVVPEARGPETAAPRWRPPPGAYESYVRGLVTEDPAARLVHLQAALRAAPAFDEVRFALWDAHAEEGNDARALAAVLEVAEASPRRRDAQFRASWSEIQLGRYDLAFSRLRALERDGPSASILNNLGAVQLRRGTVEGGRPTSFFEQAAQASPGDPDPIFNLGYAYWIAQDLSAATHWLRQAVKRNPADGEAHAVLAAVLEASGAQTEAARERELADRLSSVYGEWAARRYAPGDPPPSGLERLARQLDGRGGDALDLQGFAGEQQELARFHLDRGRRLFGAGQDREAAGELRRALFLSPYDAEAHLLLGQVQLRSGRLSEAVAALTISLWSQETAAARIALARARLAADDPAAARRELDRALVLDPGSAEALALVALLESDDLR